MADCNVILAIGTGADEPLSGSTIQIRRVEIGTKGNLEVLSAWKPYVLAEDATTIPLVQGVIYEARVMGVNGGEKVFEVPETTEAYYKDLVRVFPLPEGQNFGPQGPQGEVGPEGPAGPNSVPTSTFMGTELADPTSPAAVAVAANQLTGLTTAGPRRDAVDARVQADTSKPTKASVGWYFATDYGVVADGTTDDTVALQAAITAAATNRRILHLPAGTIKITAPIDVPRRFGWQMRGAGREITIISQATDNVPILNMGTGGGPQLHSYALADFRLTYANVQPAANTGANPILFSVEAYFGTLERINFDRGSYAIRVASGVGGPWGTTWDDLTFGAGLTLGAMDWSLCINAVPNNHFGRMFVDGSSMTGIVFDVRGYNVVFDVIEFAAMTLGAQLLRFATNSRINIGSIKLENGTYTTSNMNLIEGQGNAVILIGTLNVGGNNMVVNVAGQVYLIAANTGTGTGGYVSVGYLDAALTSLTGGAYVSSPGTNARMIEFGDVLLASWVMCNAGAGTAANRTHVRSWANGKLSLNKGDANYTIVYGDPNVIVFNTALTATRAVTLPSVGNNNVNGVIFEIISAGAVNGTNQLQVKNGATVLATLTADNTRVRVAFRRNSAGTIQEWFVLPG